MLGDRPDLAFKLVPLNLARNSIAPEATSLSVWNSVWCFLPESQGWSQAYWCRSPLRTKCCSIQSSLHLYDSHSVGHHNLIKIHWASDWRGYAYLMSSSNRARNFMVFWENFFPPLDAVFTYVKFWSDASIREFDNDQTANNFRSINLVFFFGYSSFTHRLECQTKSQY